MATQPSMQPLRATVQYRVQTRWSITNPSHTTLQGHNTYVTPPSAHIRRPAPLCHAPTPHGAPSRSPHSRWAARNGAHSGPKVRRLDAEAADGLAGVAGRWGAPGRGARSCSGGGSHSHTPHCPAAPIFAPPAPPSPPTPDISIFITDSLTRRCLRSLPPAFTTTHNKKLHNARSRLSSHGPVRHPDR